MRSGDLAGQSYGTERPVLHDKGNKNVLLVVGRREVAHLCDETKFSNSSAEKCFAEEVAQEIQTIFRPQTVLNDMLQSRISK